MYSVPHRAVGLTIDSLDKWDHCLRKVSNLRVPVQLWSRIFAKLQQSRCQAVHNLNLGLHVLYAYVDNNVSVGFVPSKSAKLFRCPGRRLLVQGNSGTLLSSGKAAHMRNGIPNAAILKTPSRESLRTGKKRGGDQEKPKPEAGPPPPVSESEGEEGSETASNGVAADPGSSTPPMWGEGELQVNSPAQTGEAITGTMEMHLSSNGGEAGGVTVADAAEAGLVFPESVAECVSESDSAVACEQDERKEVEADGEPVGLTEEEGNGGSDSHLDPGLPDVEGGEEGPLAVQRELNEVRWGERM